MSSCAVNHGKLLLRIFLRNKSLVGGACHPSRLSQQSLIKCHYSFDDKFPTQCS